jgi:hypothetical protein
MKHKINGATPLSKPYALEEIILDFVSASPTKRIRGRWLIPLEKRFRLGDRWYSAAYTADSLHVFVFDCADDRQCRMETYVGIVEAFGEVPLPVLGQIAAGIVEEHDGYRGRWLIPQDRPIKAEGLEYAVEWVRDRFRVHIANPADDQEPYLETYASGTEAGLALPESVAREICAASAAGRSREMEICDEFDRRLAQGRENARLPHC